MNRRQNLAIYVGALAVGLVASSPLSTVAQQDSGIYRDLILIQGGEEARPSITGALATLKSDGTPDEIFLFQANMEFDPGLAGVDLGLLLDGADGCTVGGSQLALYPFLRPDVSDDGTAITVLGQSYELSGPRAPRSYKGVEIEFDRWFLDYRPGLNEGFSFGPETMQPLLPMGGYVGAPALEYGVPGYTPPGIEYLGSDYRAPADGVGGLQGLRAWTLPTWIDLSEIEWPIVAGYQSREGAGPALAWIQQIADFDQLETALSAAQPCWFFNTGPGAGNPGGGAPSGTAAGTGDVMIDEDDAWSPVTEEDHAWWVWDPPDPRCDRPNAGVSHEPSEELIEAFFNAASAGDRFFCELGFPAVGLLQTEEFQDRELCSAVFIERDFVLTAGHCIPTLEDEAFVFIAHTDEQHECMRADDSPMGARAEEQCHLARATVEQVNKLGDQDQGIDLAILKVGPVLAFDGGELLIPLPAIGIPPPSGLRVFEVTIAGHGPQPARNAEPAGAATLVTGALNVGWAYQGPFESYATPLLNEWKIRSNGYYQRDENVEVAVAAPCVGDSGGAIFSGRVFGMAYESRHLIGIISKGDEDCSNPSNGAEFTFISLLAPEVARAICRVTGRCYLAD